MGRPVNDGDARLGVRLDADKAPPECDGCARASRIVACVDGNADGRGPTGAEGDRSGRKDKGTPSESSASMPNLGVRTVVRGAPFDSRTVRGRPDIVVVIVASLTWTPASAPPSGVTRNTLNAVRLLRRSAETDTRCAASRANSRELMTVW